MEFMRRYHIESHLFFVCTGNGSTPKIFGYQALLNLDHYRPGLCDAPSAEPISKASDHDKHRRLPRQLTSPFCSSCQKWSVS
jgi:hypothetical protein